MSARGRDAAFVALTVLLAAALAAVLWAWGLPLTNDGPTYVLQAWVWNHYDDPAYDYARYYERLNAVTASGFFDLQRLLEPAIGWQTAWRVNVILCAELWALSFVFFVTAVSRERRSAGLLGFALAIQMALFYGLMPFYLGTALGWLTLGVWLRVKSDAIRHVAAFMLVSMAAYCHVVAAALTGIMLGVLVLAMEPRHRWLRSLARLVPVGSVAMWIAWQASHVTISGPEGTVWADLADRLLCGGVWFQTGPLWRPVAITVIVIGALTHVALQARRGAATPVDRALLGASLVLLVGSASLPLDLSGWQFAGTRGLPLGVGLAVALAPVHAPVRAWRVGTRALIATYVVASLTWAMHAFTLLRARAAEALVALDAAPSPAARVGMPILDVTADFPLPRFAPLFNIGNLYAVVLGGMERYGHHGTAGIHHLRIRAEHRFVVPDLNMWATIEGYPPAKRRDPLRQLLARVSAADGIVMAAERADHEVAKAAGFVVEHESDALLIARFEGCEGQITLEGAWLEVARQPGAAAQHLDVAIGWWPSRTPTVELSYVPGPSAPRTMALERAGCGEVWLTVSSQTGARCEGVPPGMPVRAVFARGAVNVLACKVEMPTTP